MEDKKKPPVKPTPIIIKLPSGEITDKLPSGKFSTA